MRFYDGARIAKAGDRTYTASTDAVYWNAVGPFGGWIAAVILRCLDLETAAAGDPLTLSIQFAGPMEAGAFAIRLREIRENRSTTFWSIDLVQEQKGMEALCAFATVVIARRRESPAFLEISKPDTPLPEALERFRPPMPLPFLERLDMRFVFDGYFPKLENGAVTAWARVVDSDGMDYETLTAVCDAGLPQIFMRVKRPIPLSSVTMNVFFHAKRDELTAVGDDFLLTSSRMRTASNGFFDASTEVWTRSGELVATTEQIVWFKVPG